MYNKIFLLKFEDTHQVLYWSIMCCNITGGNNSPRMLRVSSIGIVLYGHDCSSIKFNKNDKALHS